MDAAGTILGAISFGLKICHGIVTYCQTWKHQDDDVRTLMELCQGLTQLLVEVENRIKNAQCLKPEIVAKLDATIQKCATQCDSVLHLSAKYDQSQSINLSAWRAGTKRLAQRLKFPFEKPILGELQVIMTAFRDNVSLALELLQLDLSLSTHDSIKTVETNQLSNTTAILRQIDKVGDKISSSLDRELDVVTQLSTAIPQSVEAIVVGQLSALQTSWIAQFAQVGRQIENSRSSLEAALALSQFQDTDLTSSHRMARKRRTHHNPNRLLNIHGCRCNPDAGEIGRYRQWIPGVVRKRETFRIHKRSCPLWYQSQVVTEYDINARLFFERLRAMGTLRIKTWPYAPLSFRWSISQNITLKAVVPDDAPAFRVVTRYLTFNRTIMGPFVPVGGSLESHIQNGIRDLEAVFRSGQGSPHDKQSDGTTLIEHVIDATLWEIPETILLAAELVKIFLEMGVELKLGEKNHQGMLSRWNGLQYLLMAQPIVPFSLFRPEPHRDTVFDMVSWLGNYGIPIPRLPITNFYSSSSARYTSPWCNFRSILNALRLKREFSEATECGTLSIAVLQRDKAAVEVILKNNPWLLHSERNVFGHNPIHLSIGWPEGLEILVRAGDDTLLSASTREDDDYSTPLDFAISFGCPDSIRILSEADVPFDIDWNLSVNTDRLYPEVSKALVEVILNRLQRFFDFGKDVLPSDTFNSLEVAGLESLDSKAGLLVDSIHKAQIPFPRKFAIKKSIGWHHHSCCSRYWWTFGGIFHQHRILRTTAQAFFDAGFTHVNAEYMGLTPLMVVCLSPWHSSYWGLNHSYYSRYYDIVDFLVEKGADLSCKIPSAYMKCGKSTSNNNTAHQHRAIHHVAHESWRGVATLEYDDVKMVASFCGSPIWRDILQSRISDSCVCACTSGGCRPISIALKSAGTSEIPLATVWKDISLNNSKLAWEDILNPRQWVIALKVLKNLAALFDGLYAEEQVVEDVIRFLTFSALGLTHTCCKHPERGSWICSVPCRDMTLVEYMDPLDVGDIRDEEAELITQLDDLVDTFMKEFRSSHLTLSQFLLQTWQVQMRAELSRRDEMPEEDKQQLREIGVRIFDQDSDTTPNGNGEIDFTQKLPRSYREWRTKIEERNEAYDEWISGILKNLED